LQKEELVVVHWLNEAGSVLLGDLDSLLGKTKAKRAGARGRQKEDARENVNLMPSLIIARQ
jgi:hypothetical protein